MKKDYWKLHSSIDVVYRGINRGFLEKEGEEGFWPAFVSTSTEKSVAEGFCTSSSNRRLYKIHLSRENEERHYLVIDKSLITGRFKKFINTQSPRFNEKEVLLFPGFRFLVSSKQDNEFLHIRQLSRKEKLLRLPEGIPERNFIPR